MPQEEWDVMSNDTKGMRTLAIAAIAFLVGIVVCAVFDRVVLPMMTTTQPRSIADHWRVVERYRALTRNPGSIVITPPAHHALSLAALVEAGELVHLDLVLPSVPKNRESNRLWMQWAQKHEDVFEATGNPPYADYKPSGEQPLHLRLWFRPRASSDVQRLIQDLEDLETKSAH